MVNLTKGSELLGLWGLVEAKDSLKCVVQLEVFYDDLWNNKPKPKFYEVTPLFRDGLKKDFSLDEVKGPFTYLFRSLLGIFLENQSSNHRQSKIYLNQYPFMRRAQQSLYGGYARGLWNKVEEMVRSCFVVDQREI